MRKSLIFIIIFLVVLIFIYNKYIKDPLAVGRLIKRGERAFEEEDLEGGFKYISKDYQDNWGNDYKGLYKRSQRFFNDFDNLEIVILKKKREFEKKICGVWLWLLLEADFPDIGPGRGQEYMKLELKKEEDKKWRIISTTFGERW